MQKIQELLDKVWKEAAAYYTSVPRVLTLLLPIAAIIFVVWWAYRCWYAKPLKNDPDAAERSIAWVREPRLPAFGIPERGKLGKADLLPIVLITLIYAVVAFVFPGSANVPESYWKVPATSNENAVTIEFPTPVSITQIAYFTGNYHGEGNQTNYLIEFSTDGKSYAGNLNLLQEYSRTFAWIDAEFSGMTGVKFVRIKAVKQPLELGELFLSDANGLLDMSKATITPEAGKALFDEQDTFAPGRGKTPNNGTYFDEIYHARAAYEMLNGIYPYENTHPPLGKELIAVGIKLFGMNPFGWRFIGILFGILMLPLMYILLKQLFGDTLLATFGTAVWATDFMHFTQTHIATIDTYNVFFVLLMFIFMHRWMSKANDTPLLYTLPPLILCGLSFGVGVAAKWSSAYAGLGLVAMFLWKLVQRWTWARQNGRSFRGFLFGTLLVSLGAFIVIPFWIYMASYIPYVVNKELTLDALWTAMKDNQISMFNYHSSLKSTHSYQSRWYLWLLDIRPICYFYRNNDGMVSVIDAWNNPIISWGGLLAIITAAIDVFKRKSFHAAFVIFGFFSVMIPWMVVSRITFSYHYFPANIFLIIALCYLLKRVTEVWPRKKVRNHAIVFFAVCLGVFIMFFPAVVGVPSPVDYTHYIMQWFPSWPF
ncbi:hypothetical protein FACS1894217_13880 [Clostridia bacterium]|nr:hypothetical protein FACS1894217_13880 [Clostridia bacterium]